MNVSNDRQREGKVRWLSYIAGSIHDRMVYRRRIHAIVDAIAHLVPSGTLLDVGCGNGDLASCLMSARSDINVVGLEVYLRLRADFPIVKYSGGFFPFADQAFTSVLITDTLHHIPDQTLVLGECLRVSREAVIIKDHFYRNIREQLLLRVLDIGGNTAHGVPSIFNYYTRETWQKTLDSLKAQELYRAEEVSGQYPFPFQWLLGRNIQFVSKIASKLRAASYTAASVGDQRHN